MEGVCTMNPTVQIDLTQICVALISLAGAILTGFLIPLVKSKLTASQQEKLRMWISVGVAAAEQLSKTGVIQKSERKKYVVEILNKNGFTVDFDQLDASFDAMIEAAVYDLPNKITNSEVKKLVADQVSVITAAKVDKVVEEKIQEAAAT